VTPDGTQLFYVDSASRLVWTCVLDGERTGPPSVVVDLAAGADEDYDFPPSLPTPDGIVLDEAGGLWVALLRAGRVRRYVDGDVDLDLSVPQHLVTSVCFGGADRRDLYVTTASIEDAAGSVYVTRAPHAGLPVPLAVV
jgi:sugar lactone lactonase YvrE